jgi:hypothetical protein
MNIKIISDPLAARKLWEKHSPHETLWDEWDTCSCFLERQEIYFMEIEHQGQHGLLSLWYDPDINSYRQFGGTYPENRKFWFPPEWFGAIFEKLPVPLRIFELNKDSVDNIINLFPELSRYFKDGEKRYILSISNYHSYQSFLSTFSKKHRYNLKADLKKCSHLSCLWSHDHIEAVEEFNRIRFGSESDFNDKEFTTCFRKMTKTLGQNLHSISVYDKEELIGAGIAALYKETYYVFNAGFDLKYKNAGKLINSKHIENAISLGAKTVDFLSGCGGWKELWNLEIKKQYTFDLPDKDDSG